jgi:hypothetical protein
MRADVQSWLDEPGTNFGWLLRGNEATLSTAKRFDSRENPILANQPVLVVDYTAAPRPGDYDGDGDVDLDDYGRFSGCVLGPDQGLGPGCAPGDFDSDSDVDLRDCADFQSAFGDP